MKRSDLPDSVFGIPEERKYPMPDKKHTLSAIKLFGHVENKYEKELANNIIKNMKKFNISTDVVGDNNRLKKYLKESTEEKDVFIVDDLLLANEASKVTRKRLYHLSQANLNKKTIYPRVPVNYFTKNGYEDGTTPRVCFSSSIDGCLRGLSENLTGKEFFVHVPDGKYDVFAPTKKEVPDCKVTHEVWIKEPAKLKCIGKIKVIADKGEDGLPYTYGDGKKAELYDWEWNWLERINESVGAGPVVGINSPNNNEPIYIVNYMQNNVFSGSCQERFGICKYGMKDLHIIGGKDNKLYHTCLDDFEKEAKDIKVYKYNGNVNKSFHSIIEDAETDIDFYTLLTGRDINNRSDIEKDSDFVRESYINDELSAIQECIYATAMVTNIVNKNKTIYGESYIKNEPDIYYNKDKFDSGEINLCFITGHSGSGKSTMGRNMQSDNIEHYDLDDLQCIADHFTMNNLKEYGDLIYSYFNGKGKRFYVTYDELKNNNTPRSEYEDVLFKDFVHYAMNYAKSHKNKKIVIEGVWLFQIDEKNKPWFTPEEFKNYAFYIKGTSMIISKHRGAKRDAKEESKNNKEEKKNYFKRFIRQNWKWYFLDESRIKKFRKYFSDLIKKSTNESFTMNEDLLNLSYEIPMIGINEDGRSYNYYRDLDGVYVKNELTGLRCKSYDDIEDINESVINLVRKGFVI